MPLLVLMEIRLKGAKDGVQAATEQIPLAIDWERTRRVKMSAYKCNEILTGELDSEIHWGVHRITSCIRNALSEGVFYGHDYGEWSPA